MTQIETHKRSWVKSLIWRAVGIVLLGGIVYGITGNWEQVSLITLIFHSLRVVLYYLHERIWDRVAWGRVVHPLADLPVNRPLTPEDRQALEALLRARGYLET